MARGSSTYVYVLPSLGEDLVKVGLTHDPMERFRSFHPRFHVHFDLERGLLMETKRLSDARRVERLFIERWPDHRAPPPLIVNESAGGHSEWFRGIDDGVMEFALRIAERYDFVVYTPLRAGLAKGVADRADVLYQWSSTMFDAVRRQAHLDSADQDPRYARALNDALDTCVAIGLPVETLVPPPVWAWYKREHG